MNRLKEIRERLEAATPGPWRVDPDGWQVTSSECNICGTFHTHQMHDGGRVVGGRPAQPDADLIAHAPTDLAALLAVAEAARPFARCYAPITDEDAQRIVGPCGACEGCQLRAALAPLTEEENRG